MGSSCIGVIAFLSLLTTLSLCVRNLQKEEPHFVQKREHPIVDENSPMDGPFIPHKVPKPMQVTVPPLNCKCGQHSYNDTIIEQQECGDRPWQKERAAIIQDSAHEINPVSLVINGNVTDKNQFPWVVALIERLSNGSAVHFCGGSLISSKLVLTATHCFKGRSADKVEVWLNEKNLLLAVDDKSSLLKIKAQRLILHPKFNPIMVYNDIVLVELSEEVDIKESYLRPICLPRDVGYDAKEYGYTAGWGRISHNGSTSPQLRHVCLPLLTHHECTTKAVDFYKNRVTEHMICAGDIRNGGRDACPGDSGGPLFVQVGEEKRNYLVGIVSWGEQCGLPERPGVYTRVSKYLSWISEISGKILDNKVCG